ncbi:hypothetical protein CR513_01396, partial [Mucuna pruriens]
MVLPPSDEAPLLSSYTTWKYKMGNISRGFGKLGRASSTYLRAKAHFRTIFLASVVSVANFPSQLPLPTYFAKSSVYGAINLKIGQTKYCWKVLNPVCLLSAPKLLPKVMSCKGQGKGHLNTSRKMQQNEELHESLGELQENLLRFNWISLTANTQSVNSKIETLSKGKEEKPKIASMHESEGRYGGDNVNESSGERRRNSQSSMGERREGDLNEYVDWELMLYQIVSSFDLHDHKMARLVTLEFCGYALVWWNQVLEEIRSDKRGPFEGWRDLKCLMRKRFVPSSYI